MMNESRSELDLTELADTEMGVDSGFVRFTTPVTGDDSSEEYIEGEFEPSRDEGTERDIVKFQLWPRSGLVYIDAVDEEMNIDEVVDAIDETIGPGDSIHDRFIPHVEQVWEFIDRADEKDVEIVTPTGTTRSLDGNELATVPSVYPVREAELRFVYGNTETPVTFARDTLSITTSDSGSREHIIREFDSAFSAESGI